MTTAEESVEELLETYRRQRAEAGALQRRLRELGATAEDPRRSVIATVGPQGELVKLEFPSGAHKRLPPLELGERIVATVADARRELTEKAAALLAPTIPEGFAGLDVARMLDGTIDLSSVLPVDPAASAQVTEYIEHGRPRSDSDA